MTEKTPERIWSKPTNPKDAIGAKKLPMHLIPPVALAHMAVAMAEGALKYGKYNWAVAGVRSTIYLDAIERHLKKYASGQDADPTTRVHHLGSIMACCAIILDAESRGMLRDDRAPANPAAPELIDAMAEQLAHLRELFAYHDPHHHTIQDEDD